MKPLKISVVFATLNAGSVLENCLASISEQNYPKSQVEVIIGDGGSTDDTLKIAKKYGVKFYPNPLKTSEAGKSVGLKQASGDLIAFIDSDNILPDKNWLNQMVEPFSDKEIIASEPIAFSYRQEDPILTRYFALIGMNDPLCLFLGNYDRYSYLTNKWTDLKFPTVDKKQYLKVCFNHLPLPTVGANGTLFRADIFNNKAIPDYLFDIDVVVQLIKEHQKVYFAKVKNSIVHTYVEKDPFKFFRKQLRRINDLSYHRAKGDRLTDWEKTYFWKVVLFQLQCLLIVPIIYQTLKGYLRKPDIAWLFHPIACYSTLVIYLFGWVKGKFHPAESSRDRWKQ